MQHNQLSRSLGCTVHYMHWLWHCQDGFIVPELTKTAPQFFACETVMMLSISSPVTGRPKGLFTPDMPHTSVHSLQIHCHSLCIVLHSAFRWSCVNWLFPVSRHCNSDHFLGCAIFTTDGIWYHADSDYCFVHLPIPAYAALKKWIFLNV